VRPVVLQEPPDGVFGRDPLLFCGPLHQANERHFRRVPGLETENWLEG